MAMEANTFRQEFETKLDDRLKEAEKDVKDQLLAIEQQYLEAKKSLQEVMTHIGRDRQRVLGAAADGRLALNEVTGKMTTAHQRKFTAKKAAVDEELQKAHPTPVRKEYDSDIVSVTVGGVKFTTRRTTLCRVPGSVLELIFSGRCQGPELPDGSIFFDRDPKYFPLILSWLRDPENVAAIQEFPWTDSAFLHECRFYGLSPAMGFDAVTVFMCSGQFKRGQYLSSVERYSVFAGEWRRIAPLPSERKGCAGAATNGKVYVLGGVEPQMRDRASGHRYLNEVLMLDTETNKWKAVASMRGSRCWAAACAIKGKLYVAGGRMNPLPDNGIDRDTVGELYDPESDTWHLIASMHHSREGCAAATLLDKMYVAGGYKNGSYLNSVECYDPATNTWEKLPDMPTARSGCTCAAHDGHLYVIGGVGEQGQRLKTVERYNPSTKVWQSMVSMNFPRSYCSSVTLYGSLYVLGGWISKEKQTNSVERWDELSKRWVDAPAMTSSRAVSACASL